MSMLDWNGYRQQVLSGVGALGKLSPDTVKGYVTLGGAGQKTGRLDAKTRELIALAVAISLRCMAASLSTPRQPARQAPRKKRSQKPWA
jgi:alkylhydroperoxidase/carboxymuconolactone decarboxylase family protein YurZ